MHLVKFVRDIIGDLQLLRRDKDEADAAVSGERMNERMDGPAKFQIAAETDGKVVQASVERPNG